MTNKIHKLMEERLEFYKQTEEEPFNKVSLDKYIKFRKSSTMAIKSAKKEFYKSECENCKSNQNEKWNFINKMLHIFYFEIFNHCLPFVESQFST